MNATQAKAILVAYRPGLDEPDEAVKAALELTRHDTALSEWWRTQQAFHATLRQSFRQLPVPTHLAGRIIAGRPLTPESVQWWRRPAWLAAAAVIVFLLGLAVFQPHVAQNAPPEFAIFRSRMVRAVIRQYTMDIQTNNMAAVRSFLDSRQAPANYTLPPLLAQLPVSGAGVLKWQGEPVSMVCLDSAGQGTLFLFIVNAATLPKAPPTAPEYEQVSKLMTVSWTTEGKTYLLAGHGTKASLQRFL